MTQRERVLRSLRHAGPTGVTQVDWLRFPTPDGGPPITRVAARIQELREEGHEISSSGTRDRCALYVLKVKPVAEPARPGGQPVIAGAGSAMESLFDPVLGSAPPVGPYGELEDAA